MADRPNVEDVFEAWAHVAARIRKRPKDEQRVILESLGIGPEWDSVHETWSRRLNEDIVANRMDRPERYARICRDEQERRLRSAAPPPPAPPPPVTAAVPAIEAAPGLGAMSLGGRPLGAPQPPPARKSAPAAPLMRPVTPPPPAPAPPLGVPALSARQPVIELNRGAPPMRRRAETLDLKDPPVTVDATPFEPKKSGDFRDALTPRAVKPNYPWMMQEKTTGAIAQVATQVHEARRAAKGPPAADFRSELGGGAVQRPAPPKPNQDDTQSGIDLAATVAAARQVSEVVAWSLERWARLCVAVEREPHRADALWQEQGITSVEAREHAQRQWQKRLDSSPSLRSEMMGHLARLRAMR